MELTGIHHLALSTNDMKVQIEFFTQVVGMKLVGLFPMHGTEGASHCFLEAGEDCFLSFVQMQGVSIDPVIGVSHAADAGSAVAGGAMQHLSFKLDTMREMLDMRDRLRSNGYAVFGPLDHGISHSIYFAGPEGLLLEFATPEGCAAMDPAVWVEPATGELLGMSKEDLDRYISPPAFAGKAGAVPQPTGEGSVYPTPIPRPMYDALGLLNDQELKEALSFNAAAAA